MPRRRKEALPGEARSILSLTRRARRQTKGASRSTSLLVAGKALAAGDAKSALEIAKACRALIAAARETQEYRLYERRQREIAHRVRESDYARLISGRR